MSTDFLPPGTPVDLDRIPLDDPKTYEMLSRGDAGGVFQFEGQGMRDVLKQMRQWDAAHNPSVAVTNSPTLSYGGGTSGVGVGSGQVKVYLVFWGTQWGTQTTDAKGDLKFSGDSYGAAGVAQEMFKGIGTGGELWSADLTQWCEGVASGSRWLAPAARNRGPLPAESPA